MIVWFFCPTKTDDYFRQGWVYLHPSLYYVSPDKKSWSESREDCLQRQSDLVILSNDQEQVKKFKLCVVFFNNKLLAKKRNEMTPVNLLFVNVSYLKFTFPLWQGLFRKVPKVHLVGADGRTGGRNVEMGRWCNSDQKVKFSQHEAPCGFCPGCCSCCCFVHLKSCQVLIFSHWDQGEPNSYRGQEEDCVELRGNKQPNGWNDADCKIRNFWVCEKMVT